MPDWPIDRLDRRYQQLSRQDDANFIRQLTPYLDGLDCESHTSRIVERLRAEADAALATFNGTERELVSEAVEIRRRLAADAPEIDDSSQSPPPQHSQEYAFWKIDSLGAFDEATANAECIDFAVLPYYESGDSTPLQRLIQILRGRLYAAQHGVQFGRSATQPQTVRDDLDDYARRINNLQEKHNVARRTFREEGNTLAGVAHKRLRLLTGALTPEPFVVGGDEPEDEVQLRALERVLEELGARGLMRRALDGERLGDGEQDVLDKLVRFLRAETERLHEEVVDRAARGEGTTRRQRLLALVGRGSAKVGGWVVATAATALIGAAATAYTQDWFPGQGGGSGPRPAPTPPPAVAGDYASRFIAENLPDGTAVKPGARLVKRWTIENVGRLGWEGLTLRRVTPRAASTTSRIEVPATAPGARVVLAIELRIPRARGALRERWALFEVHGRRLFPPGGELSFMVVVR